MYKLAVLAFVIAFTLSLGELGSAAIKRETINLPVLNAMALVKYKNVVYHCQNVVPTQCGHSIHCGKLSVHCAKDITVEYLK